MSLGQLMIWSDWMRPRYGISGKSTSAALATVIRIPLPSGITLFGVSLPSVGWTKLPTMNRPSTPVVVRATV